jgi:hypothetical protein
MRALIVSLITIASLQTHAKPEKARSELREMMSVRSVAELEERSRATLARKRAHETCQSELSVHLLPRACFQELALSKNAAKTQVLERLTRICIENAKTSRSRLDLSRSNTDLPESCRQIIAERLEDLRYMDESSSSATSVTRTLGPELEESSFD